MSRSQEVLEDSRARKKVRPIRYAIDAKVPREQCAKRPGMYNLKLEGRSKFLRTFDEELLRVVENEENDESRLLCPLSLTSRKMPLIGRAVSKEKEFGPLLPISSTSEDFRRGIALFFLVSQGFRIRCPQWRVLMFAKRTCSPAGRCAIIAVPSTPSSEKYITTLGYSSSLNKMRAESSRDFFFSRFLRAAIRNQE